jgi:hypothetical protein
MNTIPEVTVEEIPQFILEDLKSFDCEMGYVERKDGSLEILEFSLVAK